jgi:hypothetical protein
LKINIIIKYLMVSYKKHTLQKIVKSMLYNIFFEKSVEICMFLLMV